MGFDQILRGEVVVVVKLQRFENEKRERKKTEKRERVREEMTRYEVNGCFFCVKYMWENDTWERLIGKKIEREWESKREKIKNKKREREKKKVCVSFLWTWGVG